jgi:hypothetical protein
MSRPNASKCAWATGVMIMGLGLRFYYVRELLASMILFSLMFFSLSLVVLTAFFVWYAARQVAMWARPGSRERQPAPRSLALDARP